MKIHNAGIEPYGMKVDNDGRAQVKAVSEAEVAAVSFEKGLTFQMFMPARTLGGTAEHNLFYFKNTSTTQVFVIEKYWFGWNGGSTNFNRPCVIEQYIGATAPTANNTTGAPGNLNTTSGNSASMDFEYWDEVGTTGMTISSQGTQAGESIISQGTTVIELAGSTIIGTNNTVLVTCVGQEIGEIAITVEGFFRDKL